MKLKQLISDYITGKISDTQLFSRLDFDDRKELYNQQRKSTRINAKLEDYVRASLISPEAIVMEREKAKAILALIDIVRKQIGADYEIFNLITIQGKSQRQTAELLGVSQASVSRIHARSLQHLQQYFRGIRGTQLHDDCREVLTPRQSTKEIGRVKIKVRYPSEFLSKIYIGGRCGKRVWINHTKCVTGDYLDECFGDQRTCCAYCEKCKNKKMKERLK